MRDLFGEFMGYDNYQLATCYIGLMELNPPDGEPVFRLLEQIMVTRFLNEYASRLWVDDDEE